MRNFVLANIFVYKEGVYYGQGEEWLHDLWDFEIANCHMLISPPIFRRDERSPEDRREDRRDDRDNRRRDDRDYIPRDDREGRRDYSSSTRGRDDDSRLV